MSPSLFFSLQNKIFFIFFFVIFISISLVAWYGFNSTEKAYLNSAFELSAQSTQSLEIEIEETLKSVPKDVLFVSDFYALKRFIIWQSMGVNKQAKEWKEIFSESLLGFLKTKKSYYKARVIDLEGNEIISVRYNGNSNKAFLLPDNKLQNKQGRDYVEKAKLLKKGQFYISTMNLNIENNEIEMPYVPVVRYSTPMINENNELTGIFVINLYADKILEILDRATLEDQDKQKVYFLIDNLGGYFYHQDINKRWNSQLKQGGNFNKDHFDLAEKFKDKHQGVFIHQSNIYSFEKIHPSKENQDSYWYVISSVDTGIALSELQNFELIFSLIVLSVLLLSFILIRFYIAKIIKPLNQVTTQLKALSSGEIRKEVIKYSQDDEIGEIVSSTRKLINAIEITIDQANAVASGDFSQEIKLLGTHDQLGNALINMTKRLKEITSLAQKLSIGHYDVKIVAKSNKDQLGLALIEMIKYLETIGQITESIAMGNIDVSYQSKGSNDRLGQAILQMIQYLNSVLNQANAISKQDFSHAIEAKSKDDELGIALVTMTDMLRENSIKNKDGAWFSYGIAEFSDNLSGYNDINRLAKRAVTMACRYVNVSSGVIYIYDKNKKQLNLIASYAFVNRENLSDCYKLGEGVVGQVALEKKAIFLRNIKDEGFEIQSATTLAKPKEVFTFPIIHEGELLGVAEMMSLESLTALHKDYLLKIANIFATSLYTTIQNSQIKELLDKSQRDYEESQVKSKELQQTNVQMEEQAQKLKMQTRDMKEQNMILSQAKTELDKKAEELMQASRYKSEFLANMSHELRTPLNSIILLSKILRDGLDSSGQSKKAEVIHNAGNDLLLLINDILDLSKIEAGLMELDISSCTSEQITAGIDDLFTPIAEDKGIEFIIEDQIQSIINIDITKVSQILKNLLSNAFKFTRKGSITLLLSLDSKKRQLEFSVIDTGIGIPEESLKQIFEAFKQVDGSISREYGGTGLGLSISLRFAKLLDGELRVDSVEGQGSTFVLVVPYRDTIKTHTESSQSHSSPMEPLSRQAVQIKGEQAVDDEEKLSKQYNFKGKTLLLVDDDSRNIFALLALFQSVGAQTLYALNGQETLDLLVDSGEFVDLILMDIMMPEMDGYETIKKIRQDKKYDAIAIIAMTEKAMDEDRQKCFDAGANDYISKPINERSLMQLSQLWIEKMKD